jgi:hypothetical protein
MVGWRGAGGGVIAGCEAGGAVGAIAVPDLAHGGVGQAKLGGDGGELVSLEAASDDLLTEGDGQGAWHGPTPNQRC